MTVIYAVHRLDLKCGKGAISPGEKCTKGTATKVAKTKRTVGKNGAFANPDGKPLTGRQIRQIERSIIQQEAATGKTVPLSKEQSALLLSTRGTNSRVYMQSLAQNASRKQLNAVINSSEGADDPFEQATNKIAKRERFNRRATTGAAVALGGLLATSAVLSARGDSAYAEGFYPEPA